MLYPLAMNQQQPTDALIGLLVYSHEGLPFARQILKELRTFCRVKNLSSIYLVHSSIASSDQIHKIDINDSYFGLSCVVWVKTDLNLDGFLQNLEQVEQNHQERSTHCLLDLLLLSFGQQTKMLPRLTVPHPDLVLRPEILVPASEVAPHWYHPIKKNTLVRISKEKKQDKWGEFFAQGKTLLDF